MNIVTPCVGVWIEIHQLCWLLIVPYKSLPAWECGLKLNGLTSSGGLLRHSLRGSVD